ncbi:MAG TPA: hypothetical protein P5081_09415, partial [Phycisphaerae bacterium]|nr:hypothetical protein [Phycisphaerae bacterium]
HSILKIRGIGQHARHGPVISPSTLTIACRPPHHCGGSEASVMNEPARPAEPGQSGPGHLTIHVIHCMSTAASLRRLGWISMKNNA